MAIASDDSFEIAISPTDCNTVYVMRPGKPTDVYHDHDFSGSGCNNWVILVQGIRFDLEFVRSISNVPIPQLTPLIWEVDPFTDEDRRKISGMVIEELAEADMTDWVNSQLSNFSRLDLIAYAAPDSPDEIARILSMIGKPDGDSGLVIDGGFLREHDDEHGEYAETLDFAVRMQLINKNENLTTDLGRDFIQENLA